jgi:hypothetical protein
MRISIPRCTSFLKMKHYERRLPHWDLVGHPLFVTFRLHGSLPAGRVFPPVQLSSGKAFVAIDRILDKSAAGPLYLRMPEIAALVVACLRWGDAVPSLSDALLCNHAQSRSPFGDTSRRGDAMAWALEGICRA